MIDDKVTIRKIAAKVSNEELELMLAYIKGAVYGYTAEDSNKWFSVLILLVKMGIGIIHLFNCFMIDMQKIELLMQKRWPQKMLGYFY